MDNNLSSSCILTPFGGLFFKKKREGNSFKCMCIVQKINEGWRGIPDVGNVSDWVLHRQRKGAN